jgi:hypothetical protein
VAASHFSGQNSQRGSGEPPVCTVGPLVGVGPDVLDDEGRGLEERVAAPTGQGAAPPKELRAGLRGDASSETWCGGRPPCCIIDTA